MDLRLYPEKYIRTEVFKRDDIEQGSPVKPTLDFDLDYIQVQEHEGDVRVISYCDAEDSYYLDSRIFVDFNIEEAEELVRQLQRTIEEAKSKQK